MSISELILSENYVEAKNLVTEHMNQLALGILDEVKVHYAKHLFIGEEIDAKFKGKTDMDFVKDAKAEAGGEGEDDDVPEPEEDDGEEEPEEEDEPEADEDDDNNNKTVKSKSGNVTVNIKEGIVPVAKGKPSKDQPGGGANENPTWKGKQKALMAKGPNKEKGKTTAITEVSKQLLSRYIKRATGDVARKNYEYGAKNSKGDAYVGTKAADRITDLEDKQYKRQKGIHKATQKLVDKD